MLVNIPAAQIEVVEGDTVVSRHSGVVGKPDRPTPLLRSSISELNFNPMWTLPPTVIKEDLIPKGQDMQKSGGSVLEKYGIDAYEGGKKINPSSIDWNSSKPLQLTYRQAPGKDNPLGFLKINFANSSSVYMHDFPKESIFGRNFRAASSGCVRVQNIEKLAAWLLRGQKRLGPRRRSRASRRAASARTSASGGRCLSISSTSPPGRQRTASSSSAPISTKRTGSARSLRHIRIAAPHLIGIKAGASGRALLALGGGIAAPGAPWGQRRDNRQRCSQKPWG